MVKLTQESIFSSRESSLPRLLTLFRIEKSELTARIVFFTIMTFAIGSTALLTSYWPQSIWGMVIIMPVLMLGLYDILQRKKTVLRIYPVIGHLRYLFESIRPEIQQYFVESDTNGTPFSREYRALVYQRAKKQNDARPFGTILDVYKNGYEWINHSISPKEIMTCPLTSHLADQTVRSLIVVPS